MRPVVVLLSTADTDLLAARAQFEELRRRGLLAQNPQGGPPQENERAPGQYL